MCGGWMLSCSLFLPPPSHLPRLPLIPLSVTCFPSISLPPSFLYPPPPPTHTHTHTLTHTHIHICHRQAHTKALMPSNLAVGDGDNQDIPLLSSSGSSSSVVSPTHSEPKPTKTKTKWPCASVFKFKDVYSFRVWSQYQN